MLSERFNLVSFCNSLLPGKQKKNSLKRTFPGAAGETE